MRNTCICAGVPGKFGHQASQKSHVYSEMRGHPSAMRTGMVPIKEWLGGGNAVAQIALPVDKNVLPSVGTCADWVGIAFGLEPERKESLRVMSREEQIRTQ